MRRGRCSSPEGDSFSDGLLNGIQNGGYGAIFGGIIGGVMGGIDAKIHDRHFLTGVRKDNVIITVNDENLGFTSVRDYDRVTSGIPSEVYQTKLNDNSSVSISGDDIRIDIPQKGVRVNHLVGRHGDSIRNFTSGKGFVSFSTFDNMDWVVMDGWKYAGNSNNSVFTLKSLFQWRKR